MDGTIDGVPSLLMKEPTAIPWMHMINEGIEQIQNEESDIDSYGATNEAEFFAVASEYFFERPKLLSRKHPELYAALEKVFRVVCHRCSAFKSLVAVRYSWIAVSVRLLLP